MNTLQHYYMHIQFYKTDIIQTVLKFKIQEHNDFVLYFNNCNNVPDIFLENEYLFIFRNYLRKNQDYKLERRGLYEEQEQRNKETGNS